MNGRTDAGRVAFGVVLIAIGVAWFLAATGLFDIDWAVVMPSLLVLVGIAVLATARSGASGPLIGVGIVLTILSLLAAFAAPAFAPRVLSGGVGDRDERPRRLEGDAEFELALGSLTVDLRETEDLPDEIDASVGVGDLTVILPADVDVVLDAAVGAGEIRALGEQRSGVGISLEQVFEAEGPARQTVELDASVTLGDLVVRR